MILRANDEAGFKFAQGLKSIQRKYEIDEAKWIDQLKEQGFKACHPNDGWVDRKENRVWFQYPQFNNGVQIGDKIMLGWHSHPDSDRPVLVTDIDDIGRYYFKDIEKPKKPSLIKKLIAKLTSKD